MNNEKAPIDLSCTANSLILLDVWQSLPKNIIVTCINNDVFVSDVIRKKFEELFLAVDGECKFGYLRIFRRCSLEFSSPVRAILARVELEGRCFMGENLQMFVTNVS